MSQPMSPEVFKAKSSEEQKEALANYFVDVDQSSAERSCGDGRRASNTENAFIKNFGGSLGPATVRFIDDWSKRDKDTHATKYAESVKISLTKLGEEFDLGGHRDSHSAESKVASGCGYADNRDAIIARIGNTEDLSDVVNSIFEGAINEHTRPTWDSIIETYKEIAEVQQMTGSPTGEELISTLESHDSTTLELEGEHEEYAIVFNFARNKTLDTNQLVEDGGSAFCVDVWDSLDQAEYLGVDGVKAKLVYMAEWVATALVLVADKGKDLPPIFTVNDEYFRSVKKTD